VLAFRERVLAAIDRLYQAYAGQRLLLITHGGVMRLLLAQARGLPREQLLQVEVRHGALMALQIEAGGILREPI
jgi:alpha-ribazole phosphatase